MDSNDPLPNLEEEVDKLCEISEAWKDLAGESVQAVKKSEFYNRLIIYYILLIICLIFVFVFIITIAFM